MGVSFSSISTVVFCFTGKAPKPRKEMEAIAIKTGASITKSVTNKTTILVIANPNSMSSKAQKARAMGVDLISPKEFFTICSDPMSLSYFNKITCVPIYDVAKGSFHTIAGADECYTVENTKSKTKSLKKKKKKHSSTRRIEL